MQTPADLGVAWKSRLHVQEPGSPCPWNAICDYGFAPPQHLVATDDGGVTWHPLGN